MKLIEQPKLKISEVYRIVNDYIGVEGGYLGDFSYRTHQEFYPYYCDIEIDVSLYEPGTTREKFIKILENADPFTQAKILRGIFKKYPVSSFIEDQRLQKQEIYIEYQKIISRLDQSSEIPTNQELKATLEQYNAEYINELWTQALSRRIDNPEATITLARTLVESVCKHILEDLEIKYEDNLELPKLYKLTAEQLNLAPSQHTEQIFKQILGGCQTVVEGLGSLRNKLGDAHGKGRKPIKPSPRHAELAINLSGAMAIFFIRTWDEKHKSVKVI